MNHKDTKDTKDAQRTDEEVGLEHPGTLATEAQAAEMKGRADEWSKKIIGAAIEVHRVLGPGLLESAYEQCLAREFQIQSIPYERQVGLPLEYKGARVEAAYRLDFVIAGIVIVEVKAMDGLQAVHRAQLLTYLKLTRLWLGLLINFHSSVLRNGIVRIVN